jgi:putative ABC transport system permease protein
VDAVLLRPLPYPEPDGIVRVFQTSPTGGRTNVSDPNFDDWHEQNRTLQGLAQFSSQVVSVSGGTVPARVSRSIVSRDFFPLMGVQPVVGRTFVPEEQVEGASPAVVVSRAFWESYLDADPDLSNRTLVFGDRLHRVVGVMPEHFDFPAGSALWTPRELFPRNPSRTGTTGARSAGSRRRYRSSRRGGT